MILSSLEKVFAAIFSLMFNSLTLPSLLFVLSACLIPINRFYFYLSFESFALILLMFVFFTTIVPFLYLLHQKKQQIGISVRELLIFNLILNVINFIFIRTFADTTIYLLTLNSFIITFISLGLMIIETYLTEVSVHSTVAQTLALFIWIHSFPKSFFLTSVILLSLGLVLSLLIAVQKSTLKKSIIGLITSIITTVIYALVLR